MNPIDNYEYLTFLGEGTFGVVRLYKDKRTKLENIKERNKRENRKEQWHEQH
jgi:serine/threonine protein kinase